MSEPHREKETCELCVVVAVVIGSAVEAIFGMQGAVVVEIRIVLSLHMLGDSRDISHPRRRLRGFGEYDIAAIASKE